MLFYMVKKKDFKDIIKLRILTWGDYPGLSKWPLNTIPHILIRGRFHIDRRGRVNVTTITEIVLM